MLARHAFISLEILKLFLSLEFEFRMFARL